MHISEIENTCSMGELASVDYKDLMKLNNDDLLELVEDHEDGEVRVCTLMYNTIFDSHQREAICKKFGFKEVFNYFGNSNTQVYVLMLEILR